MMSSMNVDYLRISVTDRCNLRCIYCSPTGCCHTTDGSEVLTFGEITRLAGLFARCGIRRVRLTGGEPLVRANIAGLVRMLAAVPGIEEISLTTNGVLLSGLAAPLKEAGLRRVNVSLDAATRPCYERMTGADLLPEVMAGIRRAVEVGLTPVKLNTVVMKGVNESQILSLARMSFDLPLFVRFIEYCPTSRGAQRSACYLPNDEVRGIVEEEFGPLAPTVIGPGGGPALYFRIAGAAGAVGFISGRSSVFCSRCNRLRLTSDGRIKPCLYAARSYDMRGLLREGATEERLLRLMERALRDKARYTRLTSTGGDFAMRSIGG